MLTLGATLQLFAHIPRSWLPPSGLFAATFFFAHLGQVYQDAHANTNVSSVKTAHRWLGFIHAMYMAECLTGPFVATAVASADDPSHWNLFYTFPLGPCSLNVVATAYAFRDSLKLNQKATLTEDAPQSRSAGALNEIKDTIRLLSVWLLSLFFFFFLAVAITAGGRCTCLNTRTITDKPRLQGRHLPGNKREIWQTWAMRLLASMVEASWDAFAGRADLSARREEDGLHLRSPLSWTSTLLFQVSLQELSLISLLGFFSGPFFATGISVGSKLFPEHVKSSAISLVFVVGQIGGSIFPALTGVIAAQASVPVLQPMLVGLIAGTGISWLMLPSTLHHRE